MTAADLLKWARGLGLQLEPRAGGGLAVRPATKLPSDLADALRRHKTGIISLLADSSVSLRKEWQSVPPLDLPLVPLKPTPTPARRELVIAFLSRQCSDRQLREWLTRRKAAYLETTFKTWDSSLLTYAAARDAACWQLDRTEAEVWSLLEGIESCVEDINPVRWGVIRESGSDIRARRSPTS
ncbi:MAG: hypothetical protein ABSF51_15160 [Verrucomicrobiota bacterium]|jgi:hypothetical protein